MAYGSDVVRLCRVALAAAALWALAGVFALALAQDDTAEQAQQDTAAIERIIVTRTPIRDSQAAAIEFKRASANLVDVISADTIGRFPDQNLADSLGRVPGLAIERDQG
ncbi:MAG: TonB-dependent receptor, partial [Pseudomonadota bacterium]